MNTTNLQAIEALGNLIQYYDSDLKYITKFHEYKNGEINDEIYLNDKHGFQKFINEYKVARNVKKTKVKDCMKFAKNQVLDSGEKLNISKFAEDLKSEKITQDNRTMTSLASKILFLNNPLKIIPIDSLNKKAVNMKKNDYDEFRKKVDDFKKENEKLINQYLEIANILLEYVEKNHQPLKQLMNINFNDYRIMRYTDKLLWTKGYNK